MIYKHYERKEHVAYFILIALGFLYILKAQGATTIGNNVQSDGNFVLNSATSSVFFSNGWRISQTNSTSSPKEISIIDSTGTNVITFDEN